MARDYILEAADAIAMRDVAQWKSFLLVIRCGRILCIGVGLVTKTDWLVGRWTGLQLEDGLTDNQWSAIGSNLKNYFERKIPCQNHPLHSQPQKPTNSSSTSEPAGISTDQPKTSAEIG